MKSKYRRMCECEGETAAPVPEVVRNDYDGDGDYLEIEFGVVCGRCELPYMEVPVWRDDDGVGL